MISEVFFNIVGMVLSIKNQINFNKITNMICVSLAIKAK